MIPRYSPEEDDFILSMHQQHVSWQEIADALDRSFDSVKHRFRMLKVQHGIPPRTKRKPTPLPQQMLPLPTRPSPKTGITAEDLEWQRYWRQPRAVRRAQEGAR